MSNKDQKPDLIEFYDSMKKSHLRVDPCFMTGKGCVYTHLINRAIEDRHDVFGCQGFMITPFRPNLSVFFQNTLHPFFEGNYRGGKLDQNKRIEQIEIIRADEVRRPGIIICEGICKRIQESDFVVADISIPNDNVFYELGLAFGIGHKIVTIYHNKSKFGKERASYFGKSDLRSYEYKELQPIKVSDFTVSDYIWSYDLEEGNYRDEDLGMLLYEHLFNKKSKNPDNVDNQYESDIELPFNTHVLSNIGLATNKIYDEIDASNESNMVMKSYLGIIKHLKKPVQIKVEASFQEIKTKIDSGYCLFVRTGKDCHPMSYFWLGYGHAKGKNVVPITVVSRDKEDKKERVDDLAFDIRAQRHMVFMDHRPQLLQRQLESTLREMIRSDFSEWSRKRFWDKMLGKRGEVHIFTGALHNERFNREMIGDWDLRSASELTSYFSRHHYRAKIETPIYSPEYALEAHANLEADANLDIKTYVSQLTEMMKGKNCILIASPDVNPLTEIMLGNIYQVDQGFLFNMPVDTDTYTEAIIVRKDLETKNGPVTDEADKLIAPRAFFLEKNVKRSPRRGFQSNRISRDSLLEKFVSQQVKKHESFNVYAHLAIAPNPFGEQDPQNPHYIIVLNGVSGPATFALTHVLTGGVNEEFVSYSSRFSPEAESESILKLILADFPTKRFRALECIINVTVGPASADDKKPESGSTFDWRRILEWGLDETALGGAIKVLR